MKPLIKIIRYKDTYIKKYTYLPFFKKIYETPCGKFSSDIDMIYTLMKRYGYVDVCCYLKNDKPLEVFLKHKKQKYALKLKKEPKMKQYFKSEEYSFNRKKIIILTHFEPPFTQFHMFCSLLGINSCNFKSLQLFNECSNKELALSYLRFQHNCKYGILFETVDKLNILKEETK